MPVDTVLLSMYATVGKAVINKLPVATNQAILAISVKPNIINEYLAFCLSFNKQRLLSFNVQSTQKNVNKGIVERFKILVPPLPEQRNISYILSTVQKAIEQQDKLIRTITELKKALMQKLFTEGTRGEKQKRTEIGLVPESWKVVEFPKFVVLQRGRDLTKNKFLMETYQSLVLMGLLDIITRALLKHLVLVLEGVVVVVRYNIIPLIFGLIIHHYMLSILGVMMKSSLITS